MTRPRRPLHGATRGAAGGAGKCATLRRHDLWPDLDLAAVRGHLDFVRGVCAGDPACGYVAALAQAERFGWLVSPASTVAQPSRVHAGLCSDPVAALDRLVATLVRVG